MNNEAILSTDVLDIIFNNRNKAYGAYDLRKFYNNRLFKSIGLMLTAVLVLSAFTFLHPAKEVVEVTEIGFGSIPPPKTMVPKKEPPKPPIQKAGPSQKKAEGSPVTTDDKNVKDSIVEIDPKVRLGSVEIAGDANKDVS